ncbi:MAG: hypothetical protein OEL55_04390, partial [Desulfobulbaceae bacterium]|nr:hypothetical protein [Desulfobulbaceae bacterium]
IVKASITKKHPKVNDFRHIPFTKEIIGQQHTFATLLQDEDFRATLKEELISFSDEQSQCEIWCSLPREIIEIHHVSIPPVPNSEVANAVFWATKKHSSFDKKTSIIDFILFDGENTDAKKTAIVFLAPLQLVSTLKDLFADLGFSVTGITTPSIAFQNQLEVDWITAPESFALLHIEEQNSFIDVFHKKRWIFGREIKTGLKSFQDSIVEQEYDRGSVIDEDTAKMILFGTETKFHNSVKAVDTEILSLEKNQSEDFDLAAAERLVRQLERTFDYCVTTFGTPRATQIYIAGQPGASRLLTESVKIESGLECSAANPYNASAKMLRCTVAPQNPRQACVMNTAFGLAFSHRDQTQNFLNTNQERISSKHIHKINKIIAGGSALIALLICALFLNQHYKVIKGDAHLASLEKQLAAANSAFGETVNSSRLIKATQEIVAGRNANQALAQKYFQLGLIGEITRLLPEQIKLVRLTIEPVPTKSQAETTQNKQATMDGVVFGQEQDREFIMSGLLQQLASSPLVKDASLIQKQQGTTNGKTVLHFTASITPESMILPTTNKPTTRANP